MKSIPSRLVCVDFATTQKKKLIYLGDIGVPELRNTFAVARSLALQLLTSNIGDTKLLESLHDIYQRSLGSIDHTIPEERLWKAVITGFKHSDPKPTMILVDGLDERCGHSMVLAISKKLTEITSTNDDVKVLVFARNIPYFNSKNGLRNLVITPDHTHHDLQSYAELILEVASISLIKRSTTKKP
jgi:hypothetical protein